MARVNGERIEDLQSQIRRPLEICRVQITGPAGHKKIRLYHGPVVHVQPYAAGGQIYFTPVVMGVGTLEEKKMEFSQYFLMYYGRRRHIVKGAVDQFDPPLIRKRVIVVKCVFSVLFLFMSGKAV